MRISSIFLAVALTLALVGSAGASPLTITIGTGVDPLPSFSNGGMTYSLGNQVGGLRTAVPLVIDKPGNWWLADFQVAVLLETNGVGTGTSIYFSIYDDVNGAPGHLLDFIGTASVPTTGIPNQSSSFVYQAPPNKIKLSGQKTYWLVDGVSSSNGTACVLWLSTPAQDDLFATSWGSGDWVVNNGRQPAFKATFERGADFR